MKVLDNGCVKGWLEEHTGFTAWRWKGLYRVLLLQDFGFSTFPLIMVERSHTKAFCSCVGRVGWHHLELQHVKTVRYRGVGFSCIGR
jgi:hypothetical protein